MVKGLRHGKGIYRAADGASYDGEWAGGLRSGSGVDVTADGLTTYSGGWLAAQLAGYHPPLRLAAPLHIGVRLAAQLSGRGRLSARLPG